MSDLVTRAAAYAKAAHESIDQRRKYNNEPYFVHPEQVAKIVAARGFRPEMVAAAYLHDVVEDTPRTIDEIYAEFGDEVGRLVAGLTDVSIQDEHKSKNRKARKALDRDHLANEGADVQTIKYVDIFCNSYDIVENGKGFAFKFLSEIKELLIVMTKGDKDLCKQAWKAYYDGQDKLEQWSKK